MDVCAVAGVFQTEERAMKQIGSKMKINPLYLMSFKLDQLDNENPKKAKRIEWKQP